MTLSKEERAALVEALENGVVPVNAIGAVHSLLLGHPRPNGGFELNTAGRVVAELIKEYEAKPVRVPEGE